MRWIIPATFFAIGLTVLLITPYGGFPDEQCHFDYARHIRQHWQLPALSFNEKEITVCEAFQPPLYYAAAALLLSPGLDESQSILLLRLFSLVLGTATVWLIWKTAILLFSGNTSLIPLITAIAAFNPQFIFTHAGISNVAVTSFTCSLTLYMITRLILNNGPSLTGRSILIGICFGLSLLSRTITIFLLPVCAVAIWIGLRQRGQLTAGRVAGQLLIFAVTTLALSGWWYLRNWIYYDDPFLWKIHQTTVGANWVRTEPLSLFFVLKSAAFLHATFWAYFGRNEFHARVGEYIVYLILVVLGLMGTFQILFKKRAENIGISSRTSYLLLAFAGFSAIAEIALLQTEIMSPQGRYLYMAIVPITVLIGSGFSNILHDRYRSRGNKMLTAFLFVCCLYLLTTYWLPHYI